MPKLLLVRHSIPATDPCVAPQQWPLSAEGRARCAALAEALRPHLPAVMVTSQEAKAAETAAQLARALGLAYKAVPGLQEHRRTTDDWQSEAEFKASVARLFAEPGQLVFGAETADQAYARFSAAAAGVLDANPDGNVIIVSHGTVLSLFAGRAAGVDPAALWQRLKLPALVVVDRASMALEQVMEEIGADGEA